MQSRPHVVVIGGGIAGLAAALALTETRSSRVSVLESLPAVGGKLSLAQVAGLTLDVGAEALLLRRPEAVDQVRAVGLGPDLQDAATTSASVWSRGSLRRLPRQHVMGVPTDLKDLARTGLLTPWELARLPIDAWLPRREIGDDISVGDLVGSRLGSAVVDRLVEPLLGGVYAGHAAELSLRATLPQLASYLEDGADRSLLAAARVSRARTARADGAVFGAPRGGVGRLPGAVAAELTRLGAVVRTDAAVRELARHGAGWRVVLGSAAAPQELLADAVVVAVPGAPAARLLAKAAPAAAAELAALTYASMAVVTLALRRESVLGLPAGSGFLVPPADGRTVKAVTLSSSKWAWYAEAAPGQVVLRASVGRLGEAAVLQRDDADLVAIVLAELADAIGVQGNPLDSLVTRWGGGLPQYAVGHLDRVARIRADVARQPGLAVAGAAYDGVGIPACIASGQRAAAEIRDEISRLLPGPDRLRQ